MSQTNKQLRDIGQKKSRRTTLVCAVAMGLAIIYCLGLIAAACGSAKGEEAVQKKESGVSMVYETTLFDTSVVHTIDIQIADSEWQDLKDHAFAKEYHDCTLAIDGEVYSHVGVRTKGNSTLVQSIVREWDRHSLVFNFGAFNASQQYYGLDKISLYNNACDSSFLKDMLCYDMMRQMGVPIPLCSYTAIYLNGEYVGLYVAMESVEESFAVRNFGYDYGQLYKPEQFDAAAILTGTSNSDVKINVDALTSDSGSIEMSQFLEIPNEAVALQYLGDSADAYTDIWDNAIFKIGKNDKRRLINSIKSINECENLSEAVDMQELARYFAVNTFVLNTDCYTTEMAHNYYLYEKDGQLSMIPWDYDQTMGTVGAVGDAGDITSFVNLAIDTPIVNTTVEERPMLNCLLSDDEGLELYHEALQELLDSYIDSGYLESFIDENVALITPWVESDPTSGVSMEKFDAAVQSVRDFCALRSESIQDQLDGTIPTTTEAQASAAESLIDASSFNSPDSGSFSEMILPEGSGLVVEDALRTLNGQWNFTGLIKYFPIGTFVTLLQMEDDSDGAMQKLSDSGLVNSAEDVEAYMKANFLSVARNLAVVFAAILSLIAALIIVRHYGRRAEPTPRRRRCKS